MLQRSFDSRWLLLLSLQGSWFINNSWHWTQGSSAWPPRFSLPTYCAVGLEKFSDNQDFNFSLKVDENEAADENEVLFVQSIWRKFEPFLNFRTPECCFLNGPTPSSFFQKVGHSRPLFLYFRLFNTQLTVNKCSINFANDWIRTADLWNRNRPLYQLSHNHRPLFVYFHSFSKKQIIQKKL